MHTLTTFDLSDSSLIENMNKDIAINKNKSVFVELLPLSLTLGLCIHTYIHMYTYMK